MNVQFEDSIETVLRAELARGDTVIASARPVLRHLLANDDQALFNDEVIARVRGLMLDLARQLLFAQAEATSRPDRASFVDARQQSLAEAFCADPAFLAHAHALTLEAQSAERLQARSGVDAVLTPLLQQETASPDAQRAALAMTVLAAQARFIQQQRRMELPLRELPGELLHKALLILQACTGEGEDAGAAVAGLRDGYDEGASRLGLIARMVAGLGPDAGHALALDHAGLSIFATALALASGQDRELTVLTFSDRQSTRIALALRAAGLEDEALRTQFSLLHPGAVLPKGLAQLRPDRAAMLLAAEQGSDG